MYARARDMIGSMVNTDMYCIDTADGFVASKVGLTPNIAEANNIRI